MPQPIAVRAGEHQLIARLARALHGQLAEQERRECGAFRGKPGVGEGLDGDAAVARVDVRAVGLANLTREAQSSAASLFVKPDFEPWEPSGFM